MVVQPVVPVHKAPWGRKRYFISLPILSVVLLATVAASPTLLNHSFNVYNDGKLSITATIQSYVHLRGPTGQLIGYVIATNHHDFGILLRCVSIVITAGKGSVKNFKPDGFVMTIKLSLPTYEGLYVPAFTSVKIPFRGTFKGSILKLNAKGESFRVVPNIYYFDIYPTGWHHGPWKVVPYTYKVTKVCTVKSTSVFWNGWNSVCHT
jgi:hypothetical protein